MNDYYEANMPSGVKPGPSTDSNTIKKFIKDKYVKKLWVDEDEDDPVWLYQSGELEKRQKKKERKQKKKKDKERRKEEKKRKKDAKKDAPAASNLIDFAEGDDFGDFQDGEGAEMEARGKQANDELGDLIGADDGFGEFQAPENKDDDFGDFVSSDNNATHSSFGSVPPQPQNNNSHLLNNLSNLYGQNQSTHSDDQNNKYAALENLGQQFPQQQQPQNMFQGMNVGGGDAFSSGFQQQQQPGFDNNGFPNLTHQHSWGGSSQSNDLFGNQQNSFPSQPSFPQSTGFNSGFGHSHTSSMPANSFNYNTQPAPVQSSKPAESSGSNDLFGLKATLKKNNKFHKYDKPMGGAPSSFVTQKKPQQNPNAFSGLVSAQWNS